MNDETILVLGGTGKTGRRVAERLQARGVKTRIASRSADLPFDWNDRRNWDAALEDVAAAYVTYAPDLAIPGAKEAIHAFVETFISLFYRLARKRVVLSDFVPSEPFFSIGQTPAGVPYQLHAYRGGMLWHVAVMHFVELVHPGKYGRIRVDEIGFPMGIDPFPDISLRADGNEQSQRNYYESFH